MKFQICVIILFSLNLLACQQAKDKDKTAPSTQEKHVHIDKREPRPKLSDTIDKAEKTRAEPRLNALPVLCPQDSHRLNDGKQCACNDEVLNHLDALSGWICNFDAWSCHAKEGCNYDGKTCGFGGRLEAGVCICGQEQSKDPKLGNFLCQNGYWICKHPSGCTGDGKHCKQGEACFESSATCGETRLSDDLANYRCENRRWVCRNTQGCRCHDLRIQHGEHCVNGEAYCGSFKKPKHGNYRCDATCNLDETQALYRWICQDKNGCPCADKRCAYSAYCHDGQCSCGSSATPQNSKDYACHYDPKTEEHAWLCALELGCDCQDNACKLGDACIDGNCETRALGFTKQTDYVYQPYGDSRWVCARAKGCPCQNEICAKDQSCVDGRCTCRSDIDCSQTLCIDGFCAQESQDCQGEKKTNSPGYVCQNGAWLCDSVHGCLCDGKPCSKGARCIKGQCLCGDDGQETASHQKNIRCKDGRWICDWGALCNGQFCPSHAECRRDGMYCAEHRIADSRGYLCQAGDDGYAWHCDSDACYCGDTLCPDQSTCIDGQCLCGSNAIKDHPEVRANASQYSCKDGQWQCKGDDCQLCDGQICPTGSRCINGRCQCGQRASKLPLDLEEYACIDGEWVCQRDACRCGSEHCGRYGTCIDGVCRCGDSLAPQNAENYICNFLDDIWLCNHPSACQLGDQRCQKGDAIVDGQCQKLKTQDAFLVMEKRSKEAAKAKTSKTTDDPSGDICVGPRGIAKPTLCVDACPAYCNGEEAPRFEGYICDGLGWICEKNLCVCGKNACSKGKYCIDETYCSKP